MVVMSEIVETVRCIFHADMGHGSGSPFPPGSGAASACSLVAQHKVYTHGRSERHFPQVFTSGRNILAVHRIGERVQQKRTHRGLLCRQVMPDPTLPEHPDPAGQSPDGDGMDQPVRYSRSKSVIETQQSACLPNLGRTSFSESLFLLQVL